MANISSILRSVPVAVVNVSLDLSEQNVLLLKRIKDRSSPVDAIMVVRFMFPGLGLSDAKEIIDSLK